MKISRRQAIKLGIAGTGAIMSPCGWLDLSAEAAELCDPNKLNQALEDCDKPFDANQPQGISPSNFQKFQAPLNVLQPLKASLTKDRPDGTSTDYFEITMRKQRLGVVFDANGNPLTFADFWTYNGSIPGPLIRQKLGRQTCIRFTNELGADLEGNQICTSVHLHGMASFPQFDGYATDLTRPGQYKDYYYPNSRSSSLWYHDHAVHHTSRNVYMGLAGMYIVDYRPKDFCGGIDALPQGEFEIPLVIQDKAFRIPTRSQPNEWQLVFNDRNRQGVYADVYMVNGRAYPTFKVKRQKYYFRLLNGSASRSYRLTLSRSQTQLTNAKDPLIVVGSDAGLLPSPVPLVAPKSLPIGVGERYGVVIDFAEFPADLKTVYLWDMGFSGNIGGTAQAILQFELEGAPVPTPQLPPQLGIVPLKTSLLQVRREQLQKNRKPETAKDRSFTFSKSGDWKINNKTWEECRVDGDPRVWDVEVWEIFNNGGWVHPVHIHLIDFQIIDRNGRPPLGHEQGWKDVVLVEPFEKVRVIASFNPQPGKYMFHCHNIVHEDHDMMTQFEVMACKDFPPPPFSLDPKSAPAQNLPAKPLGTFDLPEYKLPKVNYNLQYSCNPPAAPNTGGTPPSSLCT
jgi:spore coat protein A, manganese oxidase